MLNSDFVFDLVKVPSVFKFFVFQNRMLFFCFLFFSQQFFKEDLSNAQPQIFWGMKQNMNY